MEEKERVGGVEVEVEGWRGGECEGEVEEEG